MSRKGQRQLTEEERKQLAHLMRLHLETHPWRVGDIFGVSRQYVRQLWREHLGIYVCSDEEALGALRRRLAKPAP